MGTEKLSMIGHIKDTPRVIKNAYTSRGDYMTDFVNAFAEHDFKKVFFVGSGTSHNVSLVIRNIFVELLNIEGSAPEPTLFANHEKPNPSGIYKKEQVCVIGFSQRGDSISTCCALKTAHDNGYYTFAVSEQPDCVLKNYANTFCRLVCGEEEIGPETRGYTETVFQFYIIALEIAKRKGLITPEQFEKLDSDAARLAANLSTVIEESIKWYEHNRGEFLHMKKSSIAGYGFNYPTALEARLKFFETYARPCTGYEMEEQMHGPLRAYDSDNFVFLIASEGASELARLNELAPHYRDAFTEHVFTVTCEDAPALTPRDLKFSVKTTDILSPIFYVIPFQVLSALICEDVGIDTTVSPIKKRYISSHFQNT